MVSYNLNSAKNPPAGLCTVFRMPLDPAKPLKGKAIYFAKSQHGDIIRTYIAFGNLHGVVMTLPILSPVVNSHATFPTQLPPAQGFPKHQKVKKKTISWELIGRF